MDLELFICEFNNQTQMVFIDCQTNVTEKVEQDFKIDIANGECITFIDAEVNAIIQPKDIFSFARIARARNTNLRVICQSTISI